MIILLGMFVGMGVGLGFTVLLLALVHFATE